MGGTDRPASGSGGQLMLLPRTFYEEGMRAYQAGADVDVAHVYDDVDERIAFRNGWHDAHDTHLDSLARFVELGEDGRDAAYGL